MIFYPLSGFIADVCCERLKTVMISLCFLLLFLFTLGIIGILLVVKLPNVVYFSEYFHSGVGIFVVTLLLVSLLFFIIGLVGYQANFIQLGLDQLFEAPSHYLGLFIHYASWAFHLGATPMAIFPVVWCDHPRSIAQKVLYSIPVILTVVLIILVITIQWKKHWFYTNAGQENPYKIIFKIMSFAWKHKHPLQRSAFTYNDNYIPSRFDFAKERYGGPFTTEQVENVKTFLRILVVLLSIGPVFMLEVPASFFMFPLISLHTFHHFKYMGKEFCSTAEHVWETMVLGSGALMTFVSEIILFPTYVFTVFSLLRKKSVTQFTRMRIGVVVGFLGVASSFIIDVVGHSMKTSRTNVSNHSQCMFQMHRSGSMLTYPSLNMHWSVLMPPNLLLGIGPLVIITTTYEFISAQSPQSMKV